jgi:hypothetical protein
MVFRYGLTGLIWTLAIALAWDGAVLDACIVALWGGINIWHAIEMKRKKHG